MQQKLLRLQAKWQLGSRKRNGHQFLNPVIFSFFSFPYRLLQDPEYSSLCYTQVPVFYLFYIQLFASANSKLLIYPSPTPFPLW